MTSARRLPVTLFAVPKPFEGHVGMIQRNAISSWTRLDPSPEILLLGDDKGVAEVADELDLAHVPEIETTEHGTPRVDSIFQQAREHTDAPYLCYLNADIVLFDDFARAAAHVAQAPDPYAMVGRRWMLDVEAPINFDDPAWASRLGERARTEGELDIPSSMDYLLFPRDTYDEIPPFALGRGQWDDWLVYAAREAGYPLVNATPDVTAVHQNHDYAHAGGEANVFDGEESRRNVELAGREHLFCTADATHELRDGEIQTALGPTYLWRRLYTFPTFHPAAKPLRWALDGLLAITRPVRHKVGLRL